MEGAYSICIARKTQTVQADSKGVQGITDKTFSNELKNMEANQLIRRTVYDTFPPTVEYAITPHGLSLEKVLDKLHFWGFAVPPASDR